MLFEIFAHTLSYFSKTKNIFKLTVCLIVRLLQFVILLTKINMLTFVKNN